MGKYRAGCNESFVIFVELQQKGKKGFKIYFSCQSQNCLTLLKKKLDHSQQNFSIVGCHPMIYTGTFK